MTPEQTLTAAASKLRQAATGACAGPWHVNHCAEVCTPKQLTVAEVWPLDEDEPGDNAAWIALMHPGVGSALADWLDTAAQYASRRPADHQASTPFLAGALAVARAILGEDQT